MNNKNIILISQFVNNFGTGFSRIALLILISTWFHNALYIGIFSFTLFVPEILLAAPIGYFVDKNPQLKKLLIASCLASSAAVFLLLACAFFKIRVFSLLVAGAVLYDICSAFFDPVVTKLTVEWFDSATFNQINAAISTARMGANLFSGVLVTVLMTLIPLFTLFLFDFLSYLIVAGLLTKLVTVTKKPTTAARTQVEIKETIWNGLGLVHQLLKQVPALIPVLTTALLFNILLAPNDVYFTQMAAKIFSNTKLTGIMESLFSIGFLLGSVVYRFLSTRVKIHTFIRIAIVQVPIAFLIFGQSRNLFGSLLGLLLLGGALPFFNISSKTILQQKIQSKNLAAVSNSYFSLINLSQPVGLLGIPILINSLGIRFFFFIGGVGYLLLSLIIIVSGKISPQLDY
ncbi:MFS transporter [Levilactobacillus cerevisiae]|uniref:MFS transporter n=1 Tax=Levilactobacillus cerevisiae TaxID=1704076 RepID=UPI000F76C19D|nr:MFS transporter [Levilactobacillus cerevisiae]